MNLRELVEDLKQRRQQMAENAGKWKALFLKRPQAARPKTEAERAKTHQAQYGTSTTPSRGTGIKKKLRSWTTPQLSSVSGAGYVSPVKRGKGGTVPPPGRNLRQLAQKPPSAPMPQPTVSPNYILASAPQPTVSPNYILAPTPRPRAIVEKVQPELYDAITDTFNSQKVDPRLGFATIKYEHRGYPMYQKYFTPTLREEREELRPGYWAQPERSYGPFNINVLANPNVKPEQAEDLLYSGKWAANRLQDYYKRGGVEHALASWNFGEPNRVNTIINDYLVGRRYVRGE